MQVTLVILLFRPSQNSRAACAERALVTAQGRQVYAEDEKFGVYEVFDLAPSLDW